MLVTALTFYLLLIDHLPYVTACTIAAARINAEAEGLAGESFLLFSVHCTSGWG